MTTTRMLGPREAATATATCPRCETTFGAKRTPKGHFFITRFCSRSCAKKFGAPVIPEQPCAQCGVAFRRPPQGRPRKYCSRECSSLSTRYAHGWIRLRRGYPVFWTGKAEVLVHRIVMEGILGRQLTSTENVHHLNGDRGDFRAENLELWDFAQPHGQRVTDKIAWCVQYLEAHGLTVSGSAVASPTNRIPSNAVATT